MQLEISAVNRLDRLKTISRGAEEKEVYGDKDSREQYCEDPVGGRQDSTKIQLEIRHDGAYEDGSLWDEEATKRM